MTPELKEKLLRYANEKEPFTAHNHIRVCDIDEGSSRLELDLTEQSLNRWGQPTAGCCLPWRTMPAAWRCRVCGRRPASPSAPALISWPLPGRPGAS